MATATVLPPAADPSALNAYMNYYLELADGGSDQQYPGTAGDKLRKYNAQPVTISDMRGKDMNLDKHGFQLVAHQSNEKTFDNEERVKTEVYAETAELLKKVTGATRAEPFSHIIRRQTWQDGQEAAKKVGPDDIVKVMNPAMLVHIDQSYKGAVTVLQDNASDPARLGKTRWGIINVWRPIENKVTREPIAVCDASTCAEADLRDVRAHLPQKGTGTFDNVSRGAGFNLWNVAANPQHRWYYASEMVPEEALLIKCFDSKLDGTARRSPHSAFQSEKDYGPPRQSIEVRCLVYWEDQSVE